MAHFTDCKSIQGGITHALLKPKFEEISWASKPYSDSFRNSYQFNSVITLIVVALDGQTWTKQYPSAFGEG